ncbi:hypothetical protein N5D53_20365 [Pseudomonas sp. GD03862]|uniref:hypothetical protein n=1 Tax=Pseudomonas sp. GD03862 TaxID=2975391 RepID=UPI0024480102|nr:hypothetical protein [Pseudomonas sp. GD03862]MDH0708874.1 hypothetical protein [Pseudomonas sp. GD03862]
MVAYRNSYHPIDAAILWCDLADHESEILQIELSHPGGLLKHFPQWPTLHLYAERICDAIVNGELPATYLGGPIGLSVPEQRAYWSIRHPDLYSWFARTYPHEKPAFLFPRKSDHSLCVSLGVHLALQADRDVLLRELERLRLTYAALCNRDSPEFDDPTKTPTPKSKSGVLSENAALLLYVIVGALLTLILGKSEKGLPRSIFEDQAAIVDAMTTLFSGVRGLKKRTLDRKFAEARRRFAQAGRE